MRLQIYKINQPKLQWDITIIIIVIVIYTLSYIKKMAMTYVLTSLRCSSPASGLTRWCVTSTNCGHDTTGNSPSEILHSASVLTTAPKNPVTRGTPCIKLLIIQ